jgi:protein-tyrosine-phosphatase
VNQFVRLEAGHTLLVESGDRPPARSARGLLRALAEVRGRVFLPDNPADDDIEDPYGHSQAAYDVVGEKIFAAVDSILRGLQRCEVPRRPSGE